MFAAVVFISFVFLVGNGALSWGPAKRLAGAMPSRTSELDHRPHPAGLAGTRTTEHRGRPSDLRRRHPAAPP